MTLHWWMHWFWVTVHFAVILGVPLPSTTEEPRHEQASSEQPWRTLTIKITPPPAIRSSMRIAKAISSYEPSIKSTANNPFGLAGPVLYRQTSNTSKLAKKPQKPEFILSSSTTEQPVDINFVRNLQTAASLENNYRAAPEFFEKRKDTRITWIVTTSQPVRRRTEEEEEEEDVEEIEEEKISNLSTVEEEGRDLTVLPLRLEETRFKLVVNRSRTVNGDTVSFSSRTFNGSEDIEIDQELEPRIAAATASPVLQATRLSRARSAFTDDFHRDRAEDRSSQDDEDDVVDGNGITAGVTARSSTISLVDIAAITGSCLAMIVLLSTVASIGFVMYRKKYLNPPQTLNSDKCSNPDSSGYIDDSTIRENSEEMYSLDNDSFLNSLEAMTIQNYWTDSVKHTKL